MTTLLSVTVKYFGGFREAGDEAVLVLEKGATLNDIKKALSVYLEEKFDGLIAVSALTDHEKILSEEFTVETSCELGILPPVCGG